MSLLCNVCGGGLGSPIYESADNLSITTMNKLINGKTRVFFCDVCGHLQTNELPNLAEYYATEYEVNLKSEDDDQLYGIVDGKQVYRADHQAAVLLSKVDFFPGCKVLDYGCAKAPTLKKVVQQNSDIEPYLFDVTDKYVPFWKAYPRPAKYASFQPDPSWSASLDVVLSFYALEHVADLQEALENVKSLLKPGGTFYFIVPNVYANIADFIVADHINHFSKNSLRQMLAGKGFTNIDVDDKVHDAAFVVSARLSADGASQYVQIDSREMDECLALSQRMAAYWRGLADSVRAFEVDAAAGRPVAIYGAGFYGNLIALSLSSHEHLRCFVDQNQHLQGTQVHERPVLSPAELPEDVQHVFVGLNPRIAEDVIGSIESWKGRQLDCFFL